MRGQDEFRVSEKALFPVLETVMREGRAVRFVVSGNSMWPFIAGGRDGVLLMPCDGKNLKKGDIILFQTETGHYMLHRITKVKRDGYITTGDGNLYRDGFIPGKAVRARVKAVYRKDCVMECDSFYWKFVSRVWMVFFPVRGILKKLMIRIKK